MQYILLYCYTPLKLFTRPAVSVRMGSRSPSNSSQPPAFFSKLTENNSAIVKSKKEMIKKMVVGNENDFSEFFSSSNFL